jgi:hypothetical protein
MSKRLQIVLSEQDLERIRAAAHREGLTVSEWVRRAIRNVGDGGRSGDRARKLAAVRAAVRHAFPTADVDQMLREIERGYGTP